MDGNRWGGWNGTHTHTHTYSSFIRSLYFPALIIPLSLLQGCFSSLPFYILGKSLWIGKGTPGPQAQGPCFFFFSFFLLWIIDSHCLVIHRLHMPANSSGEEKLPTSQPCKPHMCMCARYRGVSPIARTHTHTSYLKSFHISPHQHQHLPVFAKSHICTQTNTSPPGCEFSSVRLLHPPHKSQQPGMRGGSKRQVSGWKTWDDRWGALWHYEWIIPPKYLEQRRLSACIYTNLGENIAVSTLKGAGKERATELIEQSGH